MTSAVRLLIEINDLRIIFFYKFVSIVYKNNKKLQRMQSPVQTKHKNSRHLLPRLQSNQIALSEQMVEKSEH